LAASSRRRVTAIAAGQGLAFAPTTSSGIAGVTAADAGAASGLLNAAHQLGTALGLGILVTISAHAGTANFDRTGPDGVTAGVSAALTGSSVPLALGLAGRPGAGRTTYAGLAGELWPGMSLRHRNAAQPPGRQTLI
jgi:hypothetical protein